MNQDFRDLLAEFNAKQVEYLLVGGHALAAHGLVRATKDLDVWIRPHPDPLHSVQLDVHYLHVEELFSCRRKSASPGDTRRRRGR